ncbi:MAG: hypothetical protein M3O25_03410 [Actinomycetota bacterium]|nr:hypothetical protein [Actinomycetota bacterium]
MKKGGNERGEAKPAREPGDGPGSETERFRAIVDVRHNEAVTGESGVPRKQRDHELRRQNSSLAEFS